MTQTDFSNAMLQRGCVGNDKTFCGSYAGYPFTALFLRGRAGGKTRFQIQIQLSDQMSSKTLRALHKRMDRRYRVTCMVNNYTPTILLLTANTKGDAQFNEGFDSILQTLSGAAPELGLTLPVICPVCKTTGCDSYAYYKGGYRPVHGACIQQKSGERQIVAATNIRHGSYFSGLIGALLGGLVGAIPNIILASLGYIVSLACALIPLCAYYGYKLFGGKMNRAATVFVLAVSLLMVPVIHYGHTAVAIYQYTGNYLLSPMEYMTELALHPADFLGPILQILLFIALGVFFVIGIISRTGQHEIRDAAFSSATLRPIDSAAPMAQPTPVRAASPLSLFMQKNPAPMVDAQPPLRPEPPAGPDL